MTFESLCLIAKSEEEAYPARYKQLIRLVHFNPTVEKFKPHPLGDGRQKIAPRLQGGRSTTSKEKDGLKLLQKWEEGGHVSVLTIEDYPPLPVTDEFNATPQLLNE